MKKILRTIEEMDKIGKVKNEGGQGGTESGKKLIQKIKNDFHRVAQNMENVRRRLEQNPPDYSILIGAEHSEVLGHFKALNRSLLKGLDHLTQSMYSAIEQI
jgi:arginase family enzyme